MLVISLQLRVESTLLFHVWTTLIASIYSSDLFGRLVSHLLWYGIDFKKHLSVDRYQKVFSSEYILRENGYCDDGAFDYCCALGVQHTSPKSGGKQVTLIVSYCDDGASRLL